MTKFLLILASAAIAYLLGSVSCGVVVSKLYGGIDVRKHGSGNVGMTNVMRTLGWLPGILTFVGDMLKGLGAALIGRYLAGELGMHIAGVFAVVGHNWPVLFSFKGGKGISTSFGYIILADWHIAILLAVTQLSILLITGYMSLASVVSSVVFLLSAMLSGNDYFAVAGILLCAMSLYGHRSNIKRLAKGRENKLDPVKITNISKKMVQKLKDRRKAK